MRAPAPLPLPVNVHGPDTAVDCGSCMACCRRQIVFLVEGDNFHDFPEAVKIDGGNPLTGAPITHILPHREDGACVYLGEAGCTIYDKRPKMCRAFSCVGYVQRTMETTTRAERRRDMRREMASDVWQAGLLRWRNQGGKP